MARITSASQKKKNIVQDALLYLTCLLLFKGIEDDEGDVETSVGTYGLNNKENSSDPVVDEVLVLDEQTERQLKLISVGAFSKIYEYKRNGTKVSGGWDAPGPRTCPPSMTTALFLLLFCSHWG